MLWFAAYLATGAVIVPWNTQPLRVAEKAAMLDQLSGGRALLGLGRPMLWLMTAWGLFDTVTIILSGALKGAGDTRFVMGYMMLGGWLVLRSKLPERRRFRAGSGSGAARPLLYKAPSDSAARAVERPRSAAGSRAG